MDDEDGLLANQALNSQHGRGISGYWLFLWRWC